MHGNKRFFFFLFFCLRVCTDFDELFAFALLSEIGGEECAGTKCPPSVSRWLMGYVDSMYASSSALGQRTNDSCLSLLLL